MPNDPSVGPEPVEALAGAILDRLAAGDDVQLDGLGTLRRTHEPAHVEVRPDGARVLHPPRRGVRFEPAALPTAPEAGGSPDENA